MNLPEKIVNKVEESGLITIDLETFYPLEEKASFDLKDYLYMGLIVKEKDFREALKQAEWEKFRDKSVAVYCSADAIIPMWAYMLVGTYLEPVAKRFFFCSENDLDDKIFQEILFNLDVAQFQGKRILIKGCSDKPVPASAYLEITRKLRPVARSLMYGEACSNVPLFKQKDTIIASK